MVLRSTFLLLACLAVLLVPPASADPEDGVEGPCDTDVEEMICYVRDFAANEAQAWVDLVTESADRILCLVFPPCEI